MYTYKMDKVCGIITEYNPFHNGHLFHFEQSKKITGADAVIAVMSGNFVQRGEPAIVGKFARTRMALLCGVDMVLELPVVYATASAEGFAAAACRLLAATNIVDSICFGSEVGEIEPLWAIARHLCNESADFKRILRDNLARGASFPAARAAALKSTFGSDAKIINTPNNILGVEYLKAIINHRLPLAAYTIKRQGATHNSDDFLVGSASAGAIRKFIQQGGDMDKLSPLMPKASFDIFRDEPPNCLDNFSPFFHYALHNAPTGISSRLIAAAKQHYLISDVLAAAKTKNVTHSALQRAVVRLVLNIRNNPLDITYIRVLGFRREKESLLRHLHALAALPVITNIKYAREMLEMEIDASKIYRLGLKANGVSEINELAVPMVIT